MRNGINPAVAGVMIGVALIAGIAIGWWVRGDVEAHARIPIVVDVDPLPAPPCGDTWTVLPGDTMWGIAARCYPGEHTGQMVAAIREANPGVDPGRLRFGDVLVLPERGR